MASCLIPCCASKKIEKDITTLEILTIANENDNEIESTDLKCNFFSFFESCIKKEDDIHRVHYNVEFIEK